MGHTDQYSPLSPEHSPVHSSLSPLMTPSPPESVTVSPLTSPFTPMTSNSFFVTGTDQANITSQPDGFETWASQLVAGKNFKLLEEHIPSEDSKKSASEPEEVTSHLTYENVTDDSQRKDDIELAASGELSTGAVLLNQICRSQILGARDALVRTTSVVVIATSPTEFRGVFKRVLQDTSRQPTKASSSDTSERQQRREASHGYEEERRLFSRPSLNAATRSSFQRHDISPSGRRIFLTSRHSRESRTLIDATSVCSKDREFCVSNVLSNIFLSMIIPVNTITPRCVAAVRTNHVPEGTQRHRASGLFLFK